jgi:hypothetical protein
MFDITDWTPDERDVLVGWDQGKVYRGEITDLAVNSDGQVGVLVKEAHDFSKGFFPIEAKLSRARTPKEGQVVFARPHPKAEELFKALIALKKQARAKVAVAADEWAG